MPNQGAAANRRRAGSSDGSGEWLAIVAADRAFPAAVAELGRLLAESANGSGYQPSGSRHANLGR